MRERVPWTPRPRGPFTTSAGLPSMPTLANLRARTPSGCDRQPDGDAGAHAERAPDIERAAMALDDVLDDGEAKACASGFAAARSINAVETLGDARQMLPRNPRPMVGDCEEHPRAVSLCGDIDHGAAPIAAIAQRVADEIIEDLNELSAVA